MKNQKSKNFKIDADTGIAFKAIAELLNINCEYLLENILTEYVSSVKNEIENIANKYPSFSEKYPFIKTNWILF